MSLRISYSKIILFALLTLSTGVLLFSPSSAEALTIFNKNIPCDPALKPASGGCGLPEFLIVVRVTIEFLFSIAIPLAITFIVFGGIVMMVGGQSSTGGANPQTIVIGKKMISSAIWGLVLLFASWLIVYSIFELLPLGATGEAIKQQVFGNVPPGP